MLKKLTIDILHAEFSIYGQLSYDMT